MPSLNEVLEKRAETYKEIRRLADLCSQNDHKWSAEDEEKWTKANAEFDELGKQKEKLERADKLKEEVEKRNITDAQRNAILEIEADPPADDPENPGDGEVLDLAYEGGPFRINPHFQRSKPQHQNLALQAWFLCQMELEHRLRKGHLEACKLTRLNPRSTKFDISLWRGDYSVLRDHLLGRREMRAMGTGATVGGEFIPEGFVAQIESSLLYFGGMRQTAEVIRTLTGNPLPWPTDNDNSQAGALLAENAAATEQDVTTGEIVFGAFKYTSKIVRVSAELIQDSAFDISTWLGTKLGERIGRITNTQFTTGTGSAQPNGVVTASAVGFQLPTGNTTSVTSDGFIEVLHSVDKAYRDQPGAGWLMSDTLVKKLRQLKDTTNQYIWAPGMQGGQPDTLLGKPITVNNDIAVPAASAKTAIFGALRSYKIRDVAGIRLRRLVERYADSDQEGFVAFSRHDGDLLDAGTDPVKALQQSAT